MTYCSRNRKFRRMITCNSMIIVDVHDIFSELEDNRAIGGRGHGVVDDTHADSRLSSRATRSILGATCIWLVRVLMGALLLGSTTSGGRGRSGPVGDRGGGHDLGKIISIFKLCLQISVLPLEVDIDPLQLLILFEELLKMAVSTSLRTENLQDLPLHGFSLSLRIAGR